MTDATGAHEQAIYNGELADEASLDAVVSLMSDIGGGNFVSYCSGTLIASDLVLTAAHCGFGGHVYVGATPDEPVPLNQMAAEQIEVIPFESYNESSSVTRDIAVVHIDPPITDVTPILPLPPNIGLTAADLGRQLLFVGYGLRNLHYDSGNTSLDVNRQKVELTLTALCDEDDCTELGVDVSELEYRHYNDADDEGQGPCQGDSGGPAIVTRNGIRFAAGVASTINNAHCPDATVGHHSMVDDYFSDFILAHARTLGSVLPICSQGVHNCDASDPCVYDPAEPLGYKCGGCPAGFDDIGDECIDIDECAAGTANCAEGTACSNIDGFYQCIDPSTLSSGDEDNTSDDGNGEDKSTINTSPNPSCSNSNLSTSALFGYFVIMFFALYKIARRRS